MIGSLFRATASLLPSLTQIRATVDLLDDVEGAYGALAATANRFYSSTIASNLELQSLIRQSAVVLAAQTKAYDTLGQEVDSFDVKLNAISPRIKQIQKEIELATRDIVGATDQQTNAILSQTFTQIGQLQGQTKQYTDVLSGIPDLVAGLTSAFNTFQIPDFQIPQEIRSLLQGDLNNPDSQLARQLQSSGLTKEAFKEAQAQGRLLDLLIEKTNAYRAANASAASSITNSFSIITDITNQLFRSIGEDPTEGLRLGLTRIISIINDSGFEDKIKSIASAFGGPIGKAISDTFNQVAKSFKSLFGDIGLEQVQAFAENIGQFIGDSITIIGELGAAVAVVTTKVVSALNTVYDVIENIVNFVPDFVINLLPKTEIDTGGLDDELKAQAEKIAKDLDSKGLLGTVYDLVVNINPIYRIAKGFQKGQLRDIQQAYANSVDILQQDIEGSKNQIEFLFDIAPKLAKVNTAAVDEFKVNALKPIRSEVNRLAEEIDFTNLSDKAKSEINATLATITSASDFSGAQRQISSVIKQASIGTEGELEKFNGYRSLLQQRIDSLNSLKDELIEADTSPTAIKEVTNEILKLTQIQRDLAVETDPAVAKQRALVASLEATGQSAKVAKEKLEQLESAAKANAGVEIEFVDAASQAQTLVNSYDKLTSAVSKYAAVSGDTSEITKQDFAELISAIEIARQVGSADITSITNVLRSAIVDSKLGVEERLQAQELLISMLQSESDLKRGLLDVESASLDLLMQRGEISASEFSQESNLLDLKQNSIELEQKRAELAVITAARESSAKEEIEASVSLLEQKLSVAKDTERAAIKTQIVEKKSLLANLEAGNEAQKRLKSEIKKLELQEEIAKSKQNELNFDKALSAQSLAQEQAQSALNKNKADAELRYSQLRKSGLLLSDLALEKQIDEVSNQSDSLDLLRSEIKEKQNILRLAKDIPEERKLELQKEINQLLIEETNQQSVLIGARLETEAQARANLLQREQQFVSILSLEQETSQAAIDGILQIKQALLDTKQAEEELLSATVALQDNLASNRILEINLQLTGIDKLSTLEEKIQELKNNPIEFSANSDLIEQLEESAERVRKILKLDRSNSGLDGQLNLIEERAKLEQQLADSQFATQMRQLEIEKEINALKLEGANAVLEAEKARLVISNSQLENQKLEIENKIASGEIDAESGGRQIAAYERAQESNKAISESLDAQVSTNNKLIEANDELYDIKEESAKNDKKSSDLNRQVSTEYEKQDRILANIVSGTSQTAGNVERTADASSRSSSSMADYNNRRLGEGLEGQGGSFSGGNIYGVEFEDFLKDYKERKREANDYSDRIQRTSFGTVDAPRQAKLDELIEAAQKEYVKAEIRYEEAYSEAKRKSNEEAKKNKKKTTSRPPNDSSTEPRESVSTPALSTTSQQSVQDANAQKALLLQSRLFELIVNNDGSEQTQEQIKGISYLISTLIGTTKSSNERQITVLDAIRQGQFQQGQFDEVKSESLFLDPATGQLIIGGTRPDLEKLDQLINLGQKNNSTSGNSYTELQKITQNTEAQVNALTQSGTLVAPTEIQKEKQLEILRTQQTLNTATGSAIAETLKELGVITEEQKKLLRLRDTYFKALTDPGKISDLEKSKTIDSRTAQLLRLRETLDPDSNIAEISKLKAIEEAGFSSREQAETTLLSVPTLEAIIQSGLDRISNLPSIDEMRQNVLNNPSSVLTAPPPIASAGTVEYQFPGLFSNSDTTSAGTSAPPSVPQTTSGGSSVILGSNQTTNIVNNYYPDQAGSVSAQLRTAAL